MQYKSSLNLPRTDFPMKADLPKREPVFLAKWEKEKIYDVMTGKNREKTRYILHDGPPYANGHIHFGHILNKILKDIVVKYKNMAGFFSPFVPGWDCHGLPIELGAVKELGSGKKGALEIRGACRDYAMRFVEIQRNEFRRLGVFGDWDHPYLTLDPKYEAIIAKEFADLYLRGFVTRGKKPVYWCASCRTALAEAEVEYETKKSPSIYVPFELLQPEVLGLQGSPGKKISLVIWTTTPWTLPANVALAVGADHDYAAIEMEKGIFLVAAGRVSSFLGAIGHRGDITPIATLSGRELIRLHLVCRHPFMKRNSLVVRGGHVTLESGTGIVHIAPGHGQEDYEIGLEHRFPIFSPVDARGRFEKGSLAESRDGEVASWEEKSVWEANDLIVSWLSAHGFLLNPPTDTVEHSYPHCWRCKKPTLFRATEQWFLSLEHEDLRKNALRKISSQIRWIPQWGQDRIHGMIEFRPDWCLSRQRVWGVPLIIHFCQQCGKPILTREIADSIVAVFEKEGSDAWWRDKNLLPAGTKCPCGSTKFEKEEGILDVWFDSGVSHAAVLETNPLLGSPADLYLEGSDQHRGWFHSSLLTSLASRGKVPYHAVLTHGFVVDGEGKKYSKSAKNYIPPDKLLNEMGAEILRLWVAAEDYRNDIRVSDEIMKVLGEIYRKIRNTCRFLLGNLHDFRPAEDAVPFEKRSEIDRYALSQTARAVEKILRSYENFEFHVVHHTLNQFFTVALSALYLDILKDRLYCDAKRGFLRRSAQSTLFDILSAVVPLMAPILSFTAEEVWGFLPPHAGGASSVFLASIAPADPRWLDGELEGSWKRIELIRGEVLKALEVARNEKKIAHSLEAKILFSAEGETLSFLNRYRDDWPQILIVSQAAVAPKIPPPILESRQIASLKIGVARAEGAKCERCWNYSTAVGTNATHPTLCKRCVEVVG